MAHLSNEQSPPAPVDRSVALRDELARLERASQANEIDAREHVRGREEVTQKYEIESKQANQEIAMHLDGHQSRG